MGASWTFFCSRATTLIWASLVAACSGSGSGSGDSADSSKPLVNQARTGTLSPFGSRDQLSTTAAYAPGADAAVAVYTARITMPDGALDHEAHLAMEMVSSGITQTPELALVSPLVRFTATDAEGAELARPELRKSLRGEVIVDRFITEEETVVLMILNFGTAAEERYMMVPEDVTFTLQEDNSRLISFETRDPAFVFAVAAAKDGAPTNGFVRYPSVPDDSTAISASAAAVADEASQVALKWTPAEGTRTGYILKYAFAPYTTLGCQDGAEIPAAGITSVRQKFPKSYTDAYTVTGLRDNATVYFQLCSINARTPPDRSVGLNLTYELPKRALATLTGAPAHPTNVATLDIAVGGDGIEEYRYAVVAGLDGSGTVTAAAGTTACNAATLSAWRSIATRITDTLTEGNHLLCVYGKKSEQNVQTAPTLHAWTLDLTPPAAFAVSAVPTPANDTTPSISWAAATGASSYVVRLTSDIACATVVQTRTVATTSLTATALPDGNYHVCVTARDLAGNLTTATNDGVIGFEVDTDPPDVTSFAPSNEAADGYVNLSEIASTDPFGTLVATDFVTAEYSDVLDNTPVAVCDHTQAYVNATVPQIDAIPAVDDSYAVCVKLTDDAGNVTYGKSGAVVRDTDPPTLTSLALTGVAADGYVNAVDAASSGAFATLTASGHSSAAYTDILGNAGSLVCDDMQDYLNLAIPAVNTIPAVDDDYAVCVKIADAAGNAVYGSSGIAARETVPPDFTSFSLANEASDGYLNATEVGASGDFATLVAADYTDDAYSAPLDNDPAITCNHTVSYANAAVPPLSDVPATDGDYVVCVRLADAAGNVTYGVSDVLRRDVQPPLFTALALANDAADGFVNAAESASGAAFATLTASGFSVEDYSLPLADDPSVTCDGNVSYGEAAVPPISATPAVDGPYAVCVSLSDAAGNVIYGKSDVAIRDVVAPAATAVTSTTPCCSYGESSPINVTLTLDDDVTLGGTSGDVELSLETGATDRAALLDLPLGGPTSTLSFTYTVQAGDTSADLDIHATAPQLSYTGDRMLADAAGNPLNPDLSAATSLAANAALIIDTTPPSAFAITAPTAAQTVNDSTFTLTWSDPGDAAAYTVKVDDTSGCPSPTQQYAGVVTLSQVTTALADGVWYVCVTAVDAAGNSAAATNDNLTFTLATGTWSAITAAAAPGARAGASAVWADTRLIIWGGTDAGGALGDGAVYVPPGAEAWTATQPTGAPSARSGHTAVWTGTEMLVWGGRDGGTFEDTGSRYDPAAAGTWTAMTGTDAPDARAGHTAVWTGSTMIVWGGEDAGGLLGDGGVYTPPGAEAWAATEPTGAPTARKNHVAVWTGSLMLVWGGTDDNGLTNTGGRYDPTGGGSWTPMNTVDAPSPREGMVAVWTGTRLLVFGGLDDDGYAADGAAYDPVGDAWTPLSGIDAPSARRDAMGVWTGTHLLVFGGYDDVYLNSGAAYDATGDTWYQLNDSGAPAARTQAVAVWSGTELIIWGGYSGAPLAGGARWAAP